MKAVGKLIWKQKKRVARVHYSIPGIGELDLKVHAESPNKSEMDLPEAQKEIAIRYAKLLARDFVSALDRDSGAILE